MLRCTLCALLMLGVVAALPVATAEPLAAEEVPLEQADGRVLAYDLKALRTQPPADLSAMDGYAVRAADVANAPACLQVIGEVAFRGEPDRLHSDRLVEERDPVELDKIELVDGKAALIQRLPRRIVCERVPAYRVVDAYPAR